jgi:tight adherence protein B
MAVTIALLTFIVATAISLVVWFAFTADTAQQVVQRRMEAVQRAERRIVMPEGVHLVRDEMMSGVPVLNQWMQQFDWPLKFRDFVAQAGLKTRPARIILACGVLALVGFLLAGLFRLRFPVPLLVAIALGAAPLIYVAVKRQRRLRSFEEHFPEALDLLTRAIRAGHAFTVGLGMIASDAPEPIASEFRTTFEEQNLGLPLRDALRNLTERIPLIDVRFFVTSLLIQKETGGNLTEILENLSHVIRDRFRLYRDARVKAAHGRLTAGILIALPPIMVLALAIMSPGYFQLLYSDPKGALILWGVAGWQLIGSVLLWKIIHIDV